MNTFFCKENSILISDVTRNYFLSSSHYNDIILIGFSKKRGISFITQIADKKQIGYIFYQVNEYNPLEYFNFYKVYLFDLNKNNILVKQIYNEIKLYNKFWKNKINLEIWEHNYSIDTNMLLSIKSSTQELKYVNKDSYNTYVDNRVFFSSTNTIIKN